MLEKTSVSMMVLLVVAASLIGISSIHQYIEGQKPPPAKTPKPQQEVQRAYAVIGTVNRVVTYASSGGKACIAAVKLPGDRPNALGVTPQAGTGLIIDLLASDESICTLFTVSSANQRDIIFDAERITKKSLPAGLLNSNPRGYEYLYRVTQVMM